MNKCSLESFFESGKNSLGFNRLAVFQAPFLISRNLIDSERHQLIINLKTPICDKVAISRSVTRSTAIAFSLMR